MKILKNIILSAGVLVLSFGVAAAEAQNYDPEAYHGYNTNSYYGGQYNYNYPYNNYSHSTYYPYPNYSSRVTLSQSSLNLSIGQTATVYVSGNSPYSVSADSRNYVVSQSLYGNVLTVTGINSGSTTLTICSYGSYRSNGCANLYVTVKGNYYGGYPYNPGYNYDYDYDRDDLLDVSTLRIDKGDRETLDLNISRSDYDDVYISRNSNRRAASATLDDDELIIRGLREGTTTIEVCLDNDNHCSDVRVTVRD